MCVTLFEALADFSVCFELDWQRVTGVEIVHTVILQQYFPSTRRVAVLNAMFYLHQQCRGTIL